MHDDSCHQCFLHLQNIIFNATTNKWSSSNHLKLPNQPHVQILLHEMGTCLFNDFCFILANISKICMKNHVASAFSLLHKINFILQWHIKHQLYNNILFALWPFISSTVVNKLESRFWCNYCQSKKRPLLRKMTIELLTDTFLAKPKTSFLAQHNPVEQRWAHQYHAFLRSAHCGFLEDPRHAL